MEIGAVVERVREVSSVSGDAPAAGRKAIEAAITASAEIKAWLAAVDARLANALAAQVSFPEQTIADCTRESLRDAGWNLQMGPNRELTISFPDGTIHNTGPPSRRAA